MKNVLLAGLVFLLIFIGIGCSGSDSGSDQAAAPATSEEAVESQPEQAVDAATDKLEQLEKEGIPAQLESILDHFRSEGLAVDDVHFKDYEMMGAQGGIGFNLEGGAVEIYLFDPAMADSDVMSSLENARQTGLFSVPWTDTELSVAINGDIMLTGLEINDYSHPEKDRILEIFNNY